MRSSVGAKKGVHCGLRDEGGGDSKTYWSNLAGDEGGVGGEAWGGGPGRRGKGGGRWGGGHQSSVSNKGALVPPFGLP